MNTKQIKIEVDDIQLIMNKVIPCGLDYNHTTESCQSHSRLALDTKCCVRQAYPPLFPPPAVHKYTHNGAEKCSSCIVLDVSFTYTS